jgi:tellurite resistance protein TerC
MYRHHWLGMGVGPGHAQSGRAAAIQFFTGYLIEKSLSLDNIFVIALIFSYFKVPDKYQHRVLFWGILGALIMRGAMIAAGVALITRFSWAVYVFGGFLIFTALRMLVGGDEAPDLEQNRLVRWTRKLYPVSEKLDGHSFFTRLADGKRAITPLFLVLLLVESSDVIFAVDSIPAIFAVTVDPFLVFTSNIFAILGLRSLYFVLARLIDKFHFFKLSLVVVLAYVGFKMVVSHHLHIPSWISLIVIVGVLLLGVIASLIRARVVKE